MQVPIAGKDYQLKLPKPHLSYSQIDTYLRCPQQYKYKYVDDRKSKATCAMAEGQAMATTLEKTNRFKLSRGKHHTLDYLLKVHRRACEALWQDVDQQVEFYPCQEAVLRGMVFLTKLKLDFEPVRMGGAGIEGIAQCGSLGIECPFNFELAGVPVTGIADLVEAKCVNDFKVASSKRYYDPQHSLQLALYAVAFQRHYVNYIIFEKKSGKIEWVGTKFPDLDIVRARCEAMVAQVAWGISHDVFTPRPKPVNSLCDKRWCSFWDECYGRFF